MNAFKQMRLSRRASQLAQAVPQVMTQRIGRMMMAGVLPVPGDQLEYYRMSSEKVEAFYESWAAMAAQSWQAQQQFSMWWMQTWWKVALGGWMNPPSLHQLSSHASQRLADSMLDVTMRGMAPVHRKAVANAKRLSNGGR